MVRTSRSLTRKSSLPKHAATMYGLQNWYVAEFEKLGWMVLAKTKGYDEKIVMYKRGINHLLKSIEHVMGEYVNVNRKHDLNVIYMNTMALKEFVNSHL